MAPSGQAGGRAAAQAVSAVARQALAQRRRSERPFARGADPAAPAAASPAPRPERLPPLPHSAGWFLHHRGIRAESHGCDATHPQNPLESEHAATRHTRSDAPAFTGTRELTRVKISRRSYRPPSCELEDHLHPFARTSRQFADRIVTTPSRNLLLVRSVLCLFVPEGTGKTGRRPRSRQRIKHVLSVSTRRTVFIPTRKGEEAPRLAPAVDTNEH